jgi:alpha-tubulin suppressor-like RCC1 family protein
MEHCLAVTQSGAVVSWGRASLRGSETSLWPMIVEGFGAVRACRVYAGMREGYAIGEGGKLFSWGLGENGLLGHGDEKDQPSPKRIEALRGVRVSSVSVGGWHALALAEDELVYAWGENRGRALLGNLHVERKLMPKPVEALRGVRVGSIAAADVRSYAVADTGEVWAWGEEDKGDAPLGHGEQMNCHLPKLIESLRGIKTDAVLAGEHHTLALTDDGSVYAWGMRDVGEWVPSALP